MAYCFKTMLASLALILFLATPQLSHGLIIDGLNILQIRVSGILFCSITGDPDPACGHVLFPRVTGALVTISCDGGRTSLAEVFTDIAGAFDAAISVVDGLLFDESSCAAYVKLPVAGCAVLPPTGILRSAGVRLLGVTPIRLNGGLARYTAEVFQHLRGL